MLSVAHSRFGIRNSYSNNVRLDGYGLGAAPSCPGNLVGPATAKKPDGECYFVCRQSQLDPRYVTGGITSGNVCFAMYGGEKYGAGHPNVLGEFKALQRAVNDYIAAQSLSVPPVIVDGQLGPNTLQAYNAVARLAGAPQFSTPGELALAVYTQHVAALVAGAVGKTTNTSVAQGSTDNRPKGQTVVNPPEPAAAMPANPADMPRSIAWYWWALLGVTAVGVAAVGVSWYRGREGADESLFPETV